MATPCDDCKAAEAEFSCATCKALFCGHCAKLRHNIGALKLHALGVLCQSTQTNDKSNVCVICAMDHRTNLYCSACEVVFCLGCANHFHRIGPNHSQFYVTDPQEFYRKNSGGSAGFMPVSPKKINNNNLNLRIDENEPASNPTPPVSIQSGKFLPRTLSASSRDLAADRMVDMNEQAVVEDAAFGVLKQTDVITLKMDAFGVSSTLQGLLECIQEREKERIKRGNPKSTLYLTLDCRSQVFKISDKSSASAYEFLRPFGALVSAKISTVDPRHIIINFKQHRLTVDVYSQNAAEGAQISKAINGIKKKEQIDFAVNGYEESNMDAAQIAADIMFKGFMLKKGKLTHSERFVVVNRTSINVYHSLEEFESGAPAVNRCTLLGVSISRVGEKTVWLETPDREFEFRLETKNEREIFFGILQEAGGTKDDDYEETTGSVRVKKKVGHKKSQADENSEFALSGSISSTKLRSNIYSLMKILRKCMEEGCNLTPKVFVPKHVWFQKDLKLSALSVKNAAFTQLLEKLEMIRSESEDGEKFLKNLIDLTEAIVPIQNSLAQHLSYVHEIKKQVIVPKTQIGKFGSKMKHLGHSLVKKATRATTNMVKESSEDGYVSIVSQIMSFGELFETWERETEKDAVESFSEVFVRIREFFRDVVVLVVLTDLKAILKKSIKSYSKPFEA